MENSKENIKEKLGHGKVSIKEKLENSKENIKEKLENGKENIKEIGASFSNVIESMEIFEVNQKPKSE